MRISLRQNHREFFWLLVRRDLIVRYAGSTLGGLWNLIHPLVLIAIYMIVFSSFMPRFKPPAGTGTDFRDYGALAYGVHLVSGLLPWLLFSDVLMRSLNVLIENGNFLKKISFPPIVLFESLFFNAFIIYGSGYLGFLAILELLGMPLPPATLAGLGVMALLGLAGLGLGLVLSGLNVFFRDTAQIIAVGMQLLFWFNPIVYYKSQIFAPPQPGEVIPLLQRTAQALLAINPFERFITATQSLFGQAQPAPPGAGDWALIALFPVACLGLGLWLFRRMLPDVRDCL